MVSWSSVSSNLSRAILRHHHAECQWLITAPDCQAGSCSQDSQEYPNPDKLTGTSCFQHAGLLW
ncbi:hypothetical protein Nmel_018114, partial [Mimus melanotis]